MRLIPMNKGVDRLEEQHVYVAHTFFGARGVRKKCAQGGVSSVAFPHTHIFQCGPSALGAVSTITPARFEWRASSDEPQRHFTVLSKGLSCVVNTCASKLEAAPSSDRENFRVTRSKVSQETAHTAI